MEKEIINLEIQKETKQKVDEIFKKLGMTTDMAVKIFLNKVIISNGMPFNVTTDAGKSEKQDGERSGERSGFSRRDGGREGRREGGRGGFGGRDGGRGGRSGFGRRDGEKSFNRGSDGFKSRDNDSNGFESKPKTERKRLTLNDNM